MQRTNHPDKGLAVLRVLGYPFRQARRAYRYVDGGYLRGHPELALFLTVEDRRQALDRVNKKTVWRWPFWATILATILLTVVGGGFVATLLSGFRLPLRKGMAISAVPLIVLGMFFANWLLRRRIPRLLRHELLDCGVPVCVSCGYPLFDLPGPKCPECGRPFDEKVRRILDTDASQTPITLRPIGVIHSPHKIAEQTPVQPVYAEGVQGRAEILPEFADGLRDLEGFSHVCLIYWFHKAAPVRLIVKPYLDNADRGIFSTRAPSRPNPIGFSVVRLVKREENVLYLEDVDILDGTPLLDIKPYITRFDCRDGARCGWHDDVDEETARARGRRLRQRENDGP